MYIVATADPVAAIRAEARYAAMQPLPIRLWHRITAAWHRRADRQQAYMLNTVGHAGVLADYQRACHD
jgi:hypothetical protein